MNGTMVKTFNLTNKFINTCRCIVGSVQLGIQQRNQNLVDVLKLTFAKLDVSI